MGIGIASDLGSGNDLNSECGMRNADLKANVRDVGFRIGDFGFNNLNGFDFNLITFDRIYRIPMI